MSDLRQQLEDCFFDRWDAMTALDRDVTRRRAKRAADAIWPLVAAAVKDLEERLDACQLRYIEATNPGIDMDEVKRSRASRAAVPDRGSK